MQDIEIPLAYRQKGTDGMEVLNKLIQRNNKAEGKSGRRRELM